MMLTTALHGSAVEMRSAIGTATVLPEMAAVRRRANRTGVGAVRQASYRCVLAQFDELQVQVCVGTVRQAAGVCARARGKEA